MRCKTDAISLMSSNRVQEHLAGHLEILFRNSMEEVSAPGKWNGTNVVPMFRKGDKEIAPNYRPVSMKKSSKYRL